MILELAARLDRERFQVTVACLRNRLDMLRACRDRGLDVRVLGMSRIWQPGPVVALARLIRRERIELVHTNLYRDALFGRVLGRLAGARVVSTLHSRYFDRPGWELALDRVTARLADRVIAVSGAVRDFAVEREKISAAKITVLHNGVETALYRRDDSVRKAFRRRLGLAPDELAIGTLGSLSPEKGQRFLLAAAPEVLGECHRARFIFSGEGPERARLLAQAGQAGLGDRALFPGFEEDVAGILSALDVFVLPSLQEGGPVALMEAMAAGLPSVVSAIPGCLEIAGKEDTALAFAPGDPVDLADKLKSLLADPGLRQRLGESAARRARENFELDDMVRKYEKIYDEMTHKNRARSR